MTPIIVTIGAGGRSVEMNRPGEGGAIWCETAEGWWGTPEPKVELTERSSGDGAHHVPDEAVLYASRVVTLGVVATGPGRDAVAALMDAANAMAHRTVRVGVADAGGETWAEGYLSTEWGPEAWPGHQRGTVTVVCPDPRRYGTERMASIVPTGDAGGGLLYDDGAGYLLLPVQFAGDAPEGNSATLENGGTSTAYPTITVEGSFPSGVTISHAGGELAYPAPIGPGAPLVLDSLTRTASVLGVDVTRALARRDFPVVEPGGTVTISALAEGTGTVTASVRDTYV